MYLCSILSIPEQPSVQQFQPQLDICLLFPTSATTARQVQFSDPSLTFQPTKQTSQMNCIKKQHILDNAKL